MCDVNEINDWLIISNKKILDSNDPVDRIYIHMEQSAIDDPNRVMQEAFVNAIKKLDKQNNEKTKKTKKKQEKETGR